MKITKALLVRKHACRGQVDLFAELFPEGVVITESICLAHATEFDWDWAARKLLRPPARKACVEAMAPARKARDEAYALAREAYALAWKPYKDVCATARKACWEARVLARKTCDEACVIARKACDEACALAFARAAEGGAE